MVDLKWKHFTAQDKVVPGHLILVSMGTKIHTMFISTVPKSTAKIDIFDDRSLSLFCFLFFVFFRFLLYPNVSPWNIVSLPMATHSSTLGWKIPWAEEPGSLQSMGSWTVGHDWATSLSLFTFMHWGRKWQPTPVFLPGESQGWGSLVACRLWGRTESDTTEVT